MYKKFCRLTKNPFCDATDPRLLRLPDVSER